MQVLSIVILRQTAPRSSFLWEDDKKVIFTASSMQNEEKSSALQEETSYTQDEETPSSEDDGITTEDEEYQPVPESSSSGVRTVQFEVLWWENDMGSQCWGPCTTIQYTMVPPRWSCDDWRHVNGDKTLILVGIYWSRQDRMGHVSCNDAPQPLCSDQH